MNMVGKGVSWDGGQYLLALAQEMSRESGANIEVGVYDDSFGTTMVCEAAGDKMPAVIMVQRLNS